MSLGSLLAPAMNLLADAMTAMAGWFGGDQKSVGFAFGGLLEAYTGQQPDKGNPEGGKLFPRGAHGDAGAAGPAGPAGMPIPAPVPPQQIYVGMNNTLSQASHVDAAFADMKRSLYENLNRVSNQTDLFMNELKSINYLRIV